MKELRWIVVLGMMMGLSAPLQAEDLHGSIAFSQEQGGGHAWGIAWSFGSSARATAEAINQCRAFGGTQCAEVGWFREACGALAIGDGNGYGTGWGATATAAEQDALARCYVVNDNCRVEVARCSQSEDAVGSAVDQKDDSETEASREQTCEAWYPFIDFPATAWTGDCIDGKAHGQGRGIWCAPTPEEDVHEYGETSILLYEGGMRAGKVHGHSIMIYEHGEMWERTWRDGQKASDRNFIREVENWTELDCDTVIRME